MDVGGALDRVPGRPKGSQKWDRRLLWILGSAIELIETIQPELSDAQTAMILKDVRYFKAIDKETIRKRLPQARRAWSEAKSKDPDMARVTRDFMRDLAERPALRAALRAGLRAGLRAALAATLS